MRVVAVSGPSNSGKTTLIEKIVEKLTGMGYKVLAVKHGKHFELDREGKDSQRLWSAGAEVAMISDNFTAVMLRREVSVEELGRFANADIVIVEGFRKSNLPKIVIKGRESLKVSGEVLAVVDSEELLSGSVNIDELVRLILQG